MMSQSFKIICIRVEADCVTSEGWGSLRHLPEDSFVSHTFPYASIKSTILCTCMYRRSNW